jgi:hypothetical protein
MIPWPGASVLARATIMCTPAAHVEFAAEGVELPAALLGKKRRACSLSLEC